MHLNLRGRTEPENELATHNWRLRHKGRVSVYLKHPYLP